MGLIYPRTTPKIAISTCAAFPSTIAIGVAMAGQFCRRTLTNLYNQRPTWLANAHATLDAAVADAYGWPADLSNQEILERLLALNLERAGAEETGE